MRRDRRSSLLRCSVSLLNEVRSKYVLASNYSLQHSRWRAMQVFRSFHTAERTLEGVEALHMMRKGQIKRLDGRDSAAQAKFVENLFGVAA